MYDEIYDEYDIMLSSIQPGQLESDIANSVDQPPSDIASFIEQPPSEIDNSSEHEHCFTCGFDTVPRMCSREVSSEYLDPRDIVECSSLLEVARQEEVV